MGTLAAYDPRKSLAEMQRIRLEAAVYAEETNCWICLRPTDPALDGTANPWARTICRVRPLWQGGNAYDRSNAHLAHRICADRRDTLLRTAERAAG